MNALGLRMQIIVILLLCSSCVISLLVATSWEYDHLTILAEKLNDAGRLRMLSQRTVLETEAARHKSPGADELLQRTIAEFEQALSKQAIEQVRVGNDALSPELLRLNQAWGVLRDTSTAQLLSASSESQKTYSSQEISRLSNAVLEAAEANVQSLLLRFEQGRRDLRWIVPTTSLLVVALTVLMYAYFRSRLLLPIADLRKMLDRLGEGDLGTRLEVMRKDEIGQLFAHANNAAEMLEKSSFQEAKRLTQIRDSELRNRTLWEIATDAIAVLDIDGVIRFANPAVLQVLGYAPEELVGKSIEVIQPPALRAAHRTGMSRYLKTGKKNVNWSCVETTAIRRDGQEIKVDLTFSHMQLSDTQWFVGTFRDTTQRKIEQARLRLNERAMEATGEGILITDAIEKNHSIIFANSAVSNITGVALEKILGQSGRMFFTAEDLLAEEVGALRRLLKSGVAGTVTVRCRRANNTPFWNELSVAPVTDATNRVTHFISILKDVTERKKNEEALVRSANFDALTGLPNRVLLNDRIDRELISSKRHQKAFGLLAIDLDNFKIVNDNLGHEAGDTLLCEARDRLLSCVRDNDTVSRIGGDEFVVLLSDFSDQADVDQTAARILTSIGKPFSVSDSEVFVGASIGAAIYPRDGATRSELLQHADIAMYRAKDQGRNNIQHYAEHMQARFKTRLSMETQLRRALENEEFVLHYQPQIETATGIVTGAEALIRWQSPSLGLVSPAQFIPLAEETGLIVPIGAWVIDRAMQDVKTWSQLSGNAECQVAINMSARQFNQIDLMDVVAISLIKHNLIGSKVELEITESLVMTNPKKAIELLHRWRELGCHIAVDDFGTGYSSLAYLRHFPLDRLKIDKTLITDRAIVKAVIELAHSFGMKTVAEGVEDSEVLAMLKSMGCDLIQGYFYSKPLPLDALISYLKNPLVAATGEPIKI